MQLNYAKCTNEATKEYSLILHGVVGREINGPALAQEINYLNNIGATKITLRINSVGGLISEGFSVVAALLNSKAEIHTFNEGTADSMALVILASGDAGKRGAYDYATGIIHDPLIGGVTLEDIEDVKLKDFMTKTKNQLVTIFENTTGKSREEISDAMKEELMLDSKQLKEFGIVDFIQKSKKQPKIKALASAMERMAACSEFIDNQNLEMEFKKDLEAANEKLEAQSTKLVEATNEVQNLKAENTALVEKLEAFEASARKQAVDAAIECGKFDETDREFLEAQAAKDLEGFNTMVSKIKEPQAKAMDLIDRNNPKDIDEDDSNTWDWEAWEKNDPQGLAEMQFSNPSKYDRLEAEDLKKYSIK